MKLLKGLPFLLLFTFLAISSCGDKEEDDPITEIPEKLITASINGSVVDEDGVPMDNVDVSIGSILTFTDANGVFSFNDIEMNQNGTLINAEKGGYFNNAKVVFTKANKTSVTKIMLIEKIVTNSFEASSGGFSTMNGGATVDIPADGVELASGGAYSGNVHVFATWLDPTAEDLQLRMPGDLRATNLSDETVKLETYGMIGVELEGDDGEALNIADGQLATIELPVPASLQGSAPSTIPLWHFDEETGYWVEDGEATLTNGDTYVGTVSHFSFWNVDVPYNFVHIEGRITDDQQQGVSWLEVQITLDANGEVAYGYTDEDGFYNGYVPINEGLTLRVFGDCGEEIYTEQIGPFSEDAVIPTFEIPNSSTNLLTVLGVLHDCQNEIEPDGYVRVHLGQDQYNYIPVNNDGTFSGTVNICDLMEVGISGVSNDPFSQGTTTTHPIPASNELDVQTLITCW